MSTEGTRLKQSLVGSSLSKEDLASQLNVSGITVERWIKGDYPIPVKYLAAIERTTGSSGVWIKTGKWSGSEEGNEKAENHGDNLQKTPGITTSPSNQLEIQIPIIVGDQEICTLRLDIAFHIDPTTSQPKLVVPADFIKKFE